MDEQKMRIIAQNVYNQNSASRQFSVANIPFHTHNKIDSQGIKQGDIIPGTTSMLALLSVASGTVVVETTQNITLITLNGIVANNLIAFTGNVTAGTTSKTLASAWNQPTGIYSATFYYLDTTKTNYTLTTIVAAGATTATLGSAWESATGAYTVIFSSGETKSATLTNGLTTMSWSGGLSIKVAAYFTLASYETKSVTLTYGATTCTWTGGLLKTSYAYFLEGTKSTTFTTTAVIAATDTSATLSTNWTQATGSYEVQFSDGELREATLTNAATTMTWTGGLIRGVAASFTTLTTSTKKATVNGNAQLGKCYHYDFPGDVTYIPTIGGTYQEFLQSCSFIFSDNTNIRGAKVGVTDSYILYAIDGTGAEVAIIAITEWTGTTITFEIALAAQYQATWYLSMS